MVIKSLREDWRVIGSFSPIASLRKIIESMAGFYPRARFHNSRRRSFRQVPIQEKMPKILAMETALFPEQ
jgi:hypothetical protein